MNRMSRRALLRGGIGVAAGAAALGGPFQGFVALAGASPRRAPGSPVLRDDIPDLRGNVVRLWVPEGFQYRSFHDTEFPVVLTDGTNLPGRHDGMAAFPGPNGNVLLIRNHEIPGPVAAAFGPRPPYDSRAGGGTTTSQVTRFGEVVEAYTSLNGTQMNCAGGRMPWGSWITCEETVNGPDVFDDFTRGALPPTTYVQNAQLTKPHGYIFEVPAQGGASGEPITSAGRFAHEAVGYDPRDGVLYLTEDDFGFPSGLFKYVPPSNPATAGRMANGGTLYMLAVHGQPNVDLSARQPQRATYKVEWVRIEDPDPTFPRLPDGTPTTINDVAIHAVSEQGWAQGAAYFSRLEGAVVDGNHLYFCSTQGGGDPEDPDISTPRATGYGKGSGQIWSLNLRSDTLQLLYQSPGPQTLDFPDNVTVRPGSKTLVLCEDNVNDNYLRGLTTGGHLFDIALNRLVSQLPPAGGGPPPTRFNDEFAGATFSPDGHTLYVNIQASRGMTFALWGPWKTIKV
jgi:secreted PhoX family phosphatase